MCHREEVWHNKLVGSVNRSEIVVIQTGYICIIFSEATFVPSNTMFEAMTCE